MKIRITFKTTDTVDEAVYDALHRAEKPEEIDPEEWDAILEVRRGKLNEKAARSWFEYGEYVQVEWDTETNTCVVIPVGG